MSQTVTIEQLDPQGNWRAFARQYPQAAKAINAQARATTAHNRLVAATESHSVANMRTRWDGASVLRENIAAGYHGDNMWAQIARQWTPGAS